jgi:hypothetical protein
MNGNYFNVSRLYNVTGTVDAAISGAGLLHGIYNPYTSAIVLTIDSIFPIHVPVDGYISFPNPIAFNTIRASVGSGIISYS